MDTRDFQELLDRYERLAQRAARGEDANRQLGYAEDRLARAKGQLETLKSDLKAAEEKIAEWEQYGANLRAIIDSLDPHAKKRKTPVPPTPKPLETEIPF